jgi:hypothetical protein
MQLDVGLGAELVRGGSVFILVVQTLFVIFNPSDGSIEK